MRENLEEVGKQINRLQAKQAKILQEKFDAEIVQPLREKINQGQREFILVYRQIITPGKREGRDYYQDQRHFFETGIIDGEVLEGHNSLKVIYAPSTAGFYAGEGPSENYNSDEDLIVPVRRRLTTCSHDCLGEAGKECFYCLEFSIEDLEKLGQGEIAFSLMELYGKRSLENVFEFEFPQSILERHNAAYINRFGIFVGREEILDFLQRKEVEKEYVEKFLRVLEDPKEVPRLLGGAYKKESRKIVEGLVKNVSDARRIFGEIERIATDVKKIRFHETPVDQDGSSGIKCSDYETYEGYRRLGNEFDDVCVRVDELLKKRAKSFLIQNHPFIDGRIIGVPTEIPTEKYFDFIDIFLPQARELIGELDTSLRDAQVKAK